MTADQGAGADRPPMATGPEDLAVVVVNTNSGDEVRRCVKSVFEQSGDIGMQVIVVDNDSTDGSAQEVLRAFPQVRLIQNDSNRGFPAAANQGMRASNSEFVLLINPDAEIQSGTLEGLLKVARDHPRAGAIGTLTRNPDGTVYPSARRVPTLAQGLFHTLVAPFRPNNRWSRAYRMADWDRRSERQVDWVSGSSMLLRRAALEEVGIFDERFFMYVEDMDLCTRLRRGGWEVWFSPELEVEHIGGTATAGRRRMTLEHSKSIYHYFVKHRSSGWRAALRPLAWVLLRLRAAVVSWQRHET
jgi:N-acetylglucosaminyl-diphospho-decaprenol L-rhamnosyltransferase